MEQKKKLPRRLPCPDRLRTFPRAFGWIDVEFLRQGWISRLPGEHVVVYLFLSLVADHQGLSFYRVDSIARQLALDERIVFQARDRLIELGLVAFEPFRPGQVDGFWQVLPVPTCPTKESKLFPWT